MARGKRFDWERELLACDFRGTAHKRATVIVIGLVLATHFAADLTAWPSAKLLAQEAGCNPETVRRVIAVLEDVGLIGVDRRGPGAGARNTNHYRGLLAEDRNGPAEGRYLPRETVPQRAIPEYSSVPAEARKRPPAGIEMIPSSTPNSKEQHMNSTARDSQTLAELKQEHPDLWSSALSEVQLRIDSGKSIPKPQAYAVPVFMDMVAIRRGESRATAESAAFANARAECDNCDEAGWYWEEQEAPYGPRAFVCDHGGAEPLG